MYWKCVPTFWRNVFSPSSGCLVDVVAEVVGRKECVIYIGNFEKLLADRRWNGACTEIMGITSASTWIIQWPWRSRHCFSGTPEEPFTDGVNPPSEHHNLRNNLKTCTVYSTCNTTNVFNVVQGQWANSCAKLHLLCIWTCNHISCTGNV